MRIRHAVFGFLVIGLFFGTVAVAAATGSWQTTGRGSGGGEGGGAGASTTLTGTSSTEVKGWMTIGDVATAFGIPLPEILEAFALPADTPPATPIKELESETFSVANLRAWLDERGAPAP